MLIAFVIGGDGGSSLTGLDERDKLLEILQKEVGLLQCREVTALKDRVSVMCLRLLPSLIREDTSNARRLALSCRLYNTRLGKSFSAHDCGSAIISDGYDEYPNGFVEGTEGKVDPLRLYAHILRPNELVYQ